jgi:hypothetical protein
MRNNYFLNKFFSKATFKICLLLVSLAFNTLLFGQSQTQFAGFGATSGGAGTAWNNTNLIYTDNNNSASVDGTSEQLLSTNYGFNIPAGSIINGIELEIDRRTSATNGTRTATDNVVRLIKNGNVVGDNKANATNYGTGFAVITYGSPTDLWGTTWTADQINANNFGAAFSVTLNGGTQTVYVDFMRITVYYTAPPTISTFSPALACANSGQTVTITGTNFTNTSSVTFNGIPATFTVNSSTQITATLPNGATTGAISVTTPIGTTNSSNFTINPSPTNVTATSNLSSICVGQTINLSSSATSNSNTATSLLSENFNGFGLPTEWSSTNSSTGGNPGNAAWTSRANNYNQGEGQIRSNDTSRFFMTDSDEQGNNSTTNTTLVSPSFSTIGISAASLSFYHHYDDNGNSGDFAYVEISTDGVNWTTLQTYNSDQGTRTNFANQTISLNGYLNQPSVQIRYRYVATYDWYWAIDNVSVTATPATPAISYAWTSTPAGFTSTQQNPTGVTPTEDTTYTVRVTNNYGCWTEASTSVTVVQNSLVGPASSTPTVCINTAIIDITHSTTYATGIGTATGLPNGVVASWNADTITISGTPTESGTFNYNIPLTGGCGTASATGTIEVTPVTNTVDVASPLTSILCINTALTDITHNTTGTTGIGTPLNLPAGVTATWNNNVITISGTPTETGTFNYSIPLDGCGNVAATGEITVIDSSTVSAASSTPTLCINIPLTDITHSTVVATGIGTPVGLPDGVTASWSSDVITISGTPTTSGVFNYSIPVIGCGTAMATGTITVEEPVDAAGTISGNDTVCQGETGVVYSVATIANATNYVWNLPTGATITSGENTNSITVSFAANAVSGTVNVQGNNSCGDGLISADFAVTVNPLPADAGTITGSASVCVGQTGVIYTVSPILNVIDYNWTLPTGATIVSGNNTNSITVDFGTNAISGTITVQGSNNCGNGVISEALSITVDTLSEAPTSISGVTTICEGYSTTLTLVGGVQGTNTIAEWFIDACGVTAIGTGNSITVSPITTTTYYVRYNGNCTITACASVTVTVNPLPVAAGAFTTSSATVCEGQTNVTYTIPTIDFASNYIWTLPTGAILVSGDNTNSITVDFPSTVSGNISVHGSNSCGVGSASTIAITINPLPVAAGTISGATIVCRGQNGVVYSVPTITNASSYIWTLPTGATIVSGLNTETITVNFSGTATSGDITVQGQNACGTGMVSAIYPITVKIPSVAPTSIIGTTTICEGTSTTLTLADGSAGTGAIIEWFSGSCGGTSIGTGNSIIVSPIITTTYYARYNGDCNTTACTSVTVNVNPLPVAAGTISGPSGVCQGEEGINFSIPVIANASSYVWTLPVGATITSGGNNSIFVNFSAIAESGNITVYGQNACGVGSTSTLVVTLNASPLIADNYDSTICSGSNVSITPSNGGGNIIPPSTTYSWELPTLTGGITGATAQTGQSSFSQTLTNTSGSQQTATYTVSASTNGCSSSTFTITITVDPRPTVAVSPASLSPICSGQTIDITPYNPNMISGSIDYNWTRTDSNTNVTGLNSGSDSISGALYNTSNVPQTVNFSITATSDAGCSSTTPATISVVVNPMPSITAPVSICTDNNATLTTTISGGTWTSSDTDIATISNAGVVTPVSEGVVTFTYTLSSGCSDSKTVNIYASPVLTAPATICQGSTATLSPTTGGTWTSSNPSVASITNSGVVTPGNTGTVTFTFTTNDGCSRTTASIQVLTAPPVINSVTSTQNTVCSGNPSILEVNVDGVLSNPITLINFDFNNGNNYANLDDQNIAGVACTVSDDNLGFNAPNNSGTTTNAQAFTVNGTAGRGLQQTDDGNSNDAGYWQFNMTGAAVQNYQNFRIYFQAKRATTYGNDKTITVQYRRNGAGVWNDLGTVNLYTTTTDWQTGLFPLPAAANNPNSLQFRLSVSDGWTANNQSERRPHVTIDNFQIQGVTVTDNTLYSWTANTGANAGLPVNAGTPSNNNDQITVRPEVTTTYTAIATNSVGCSSTSNITVNVYPTPEITVAVDYCPTDVIGTPQDESNMVKLVASCTNTTISSWLWSTGETGNTIYVDVADAYQVIGTSTNGCLGSASANIAQELVFNGDFTLGNTGFGTDYTYRADVAGNTELVNDQIGPGYVNGYSITNNANNVHNNFWGRDHTQNLTGNQNFMVVNGHGTQYVVWRQTVTVEANTTYYFSAWGMSLNNAGPFANLQFRVNGQTHGTTLQLISHPENNNQSSDNWRRFYGTWQTTTGGDILIEIINLENSFSGNDFGIDDISFGTLSTFIRLNSDDSTDEQTVCQNTPINDIVYSIGGGLTAPAINWKHNNNDLGTNVFPDGLSYIFNGLTYTITGSPTVYGDYEYSVETGSDCGEPKTAGGTLIVHEAPTATITPISATCLSEGYVTVSATFGGSATGGNWSGGTGTFQNTTTTGNTVTADYHFGAGETTSITLTFTATAPLSSVCTNNITQVPIRINNINPRTITAPASVCMPIPALTITGQTATVSAVNNDAIITYQWESSTVDCNSGFSDITVDGNGQNYTIPAGLSVTTYFKRKATSTLNGVSCSAYSNCIVITANDVTAGTISADQTICRLVTPEALTFTILPTAPIGATITYLWQRKTSATGDCTSGAWGNAEGVNNTDTYTPPALATTTYYRVRVTSTLNGLSCTVASNCITITVNPLITAGSISGNRTVCYGGDPAAFTNTSAGTGSSYQWQNSLDNISFNNIPGATSITYDEPGPIYQTTYYRRVTYSTTNGITCQAVTTSVIVFVNHITDAPVISGAQTACNVGGVSELSITNDAVSNGTITYRWQISTTGCSGSFTDIDPVASSDTYTPAVLNTTSYYRVRVSSTLNGVTCTDVFSNCIEVTYTGKTWNGLVSDNWNEPNNWTPIGVPNATNCVVIPNVTNDPIIQGTNTNAYALNLTVLNGGVLEVNSTNNITVTDFVNVYPTGLFDIKNNASLIQINDNAVNVGNIKYTRVSRSMTRYAYVYWGSPVAGNVIGQIPSQFDLKYRWEPNTGSPDGTWLPLTAITAGEGFITRVKNIAPFSTGVGTIPFTFTGVPNNGIINVNVDSYDSSSMVSANTALLANPYPSVIDAEEFLTHPNNTELGGTLSFWTSVTLYSGTGPYNAQDYASWNLTGGTVTTNPPLNDPSESLRPNGKIAAGQGFFAQVFADGQITFNNAMRESGNNTQFYRTNGSNEKHRIWLNLFDQNKFRQTLIGYVGGATNEFDRLYDGDAFTSNEINIYSLLDNHALVIQGRALPFDDNDVIPIGYKITTAGTYNIGIDEIDGIFAGSQNVYLKDKLLNVIHDIKANNYSFVTGSGTFDNRFEIVFRNGSLGIDNPIADVAQAYIKDETLYINATKDIKKIVLYDIAGKKLTTFTNDIPVNNFKTEFNYPNGVYLAKVKMDDNSIVNIKIAN